MRSVYINGLFGSQGIQLKEGFLRWRDKAAGSVAIANPICPATP